MASQVEAIKWVPGTRFIVDGFRFQSPSCTTYFLTHCHSDHTTGLSKSFDSGLIYCTMVSYRLLVHEVGIRPQVLRPLELDRTVVIDGVEVTPICANHCPGAAMLLFRVPQQGAPPRVILHTGDFRWDAELHGRHPALVSTRIDTLVLDTTYCAAKWTFPSQREVVAAMADLMRAEAQAEPATLFVSMSYHIGKERAYLGAAHALGWRVWCSPAKRKTLELLALPPEWTALLVDEPADAAMHVLGMGDQLQPQALAESIAGTKWKRVVSLRPTGWSYRRSGKLDRREVGVVTTIGIPYSEHSSFAELQDCVRTLRPRKLIPTVNAGDAAKSRSIVDKLCAFMDLSEDRSRLDCYFARGEGSGKAHEDSGAAAAAGSRGEGVGKPVMVATPAPVAAAAAHAENANEGALDCGPVAEGGSECAPAEEGRPEEGLVQQAEGEAVDLASVDILEQQRILDAILAEAQRPPGSGGPKKQRSIKAFLSG